MSNYLIQGETLTGIADAIRGKTGNAAALTPIDMPAAIAGIQTGGGSGSGGGAAVAEKEVNFYDYDGTLVHSYSVVEAQALTELPAGPEHEGLVFQKWNWPLEGVKALTRPMNIGALYTTDDGTTRIYIRLEEGRTSPMLGICVDGTVTVDWGDGTEPETLTGSNRYVPTWTSNHAYPKAGDYVIKLSTDTEAAISGTEFNDCSALLVYSNDSQDGRNAAYSNAIYKVEIGTNIKIQTAAFYKCYSLKTISMPSGAIDNDPADMFKDCVSLKSINIPDGELIPSFMGCSMLKTVSFPYVGESTSVTVHGYFFQNCHALSSVMLPNRCYLNSQYIFQNCDSLIYFGVPDSKNLSIPMYTFAGCKSLRYLDCAHSTAVPSLGFFVFDDAPGDLEIRVPASLYDTWIASANWATYASQIVAVGGSIPQ